MADRKISDLPLDTNLSGNENLVTEETGSNARIVLTTLKDWILGFVNTLFIQTNRPIKTINGESLEGSDNLVLDTFPEAPEDGQQYARQNAAWSVVVGGGGDVPIATDTVVGGFKVAFDSANEVRSYDENVTPIVPTV